MAKRRAGAGSLLKQAEIKNRVRRILKKMRAFLEIINGRYAGTTYLVETDEVCTVGKTFGADLFLPNDDLLEPLHFIVKSEVETVVLEKLSGEVFVNNQPCEQGKLAHGDFIFAGKTLFQMTFEGEKKSDETVLGKLIERLSKISKLTLLIDENIDRRILPMLEEHKAMFQQLKKTEGFEAMTANPLLVKISGEPRLLETLVRSFWGKGFLVFFEAKKDSAEMIADFQSLLEKNPTPKINPIQVLVRQAGLILICLKLNQSKR